MVDTSPSLLERLRRTDDQQAWSRFVYLYTPLLQGWLARLGAGGDEIADVIQDVFVVLVRRLPEFRYDSRLSFRAWLRSVAVSRWRDRQRLRVARPVDDAAPVMADLAVDEADSLDAADYNAYLTGRALRLIQTDFPGPTWQAFWGVVVDGRPAAEVAAGLGVSVNAVYLAKSRVLRRLREELAGLLD